MKGCVHQLRWFNVNLQWMLCVLKLSKCRAVEKMCRSKLTRFRVFVVLALFPHTPTSVLPLSYSPSH